MIALMNQTKKITSIRIRRAIQKDTQRIDELLLQVLSVHASGRPDIFKKGTRKYSDEELEVLIADDTRPIFVAVDSDDQVVGYSFCVIISHAGSNNLQNYLELYIDDLCVDDELRGSYIGQRLFEYSKSYAKKIGCYNLTLNVWACNPGAMAFYEKQGMHMLKKEMETIL